MAPPRVTSKTHVAMAQPKLSDFTEDPFRDYRYEDPFNITDPFADETEDLNAGRGTNKIDPFGFETRSAFSSKNPSTKVFDNDFSNTFPLAKAKSERNNTSDTSNASKFDVDFGKAFSADNKNVRDVEADFSQAFANVKAKTINLDEAFSTKGAKAITRHESDVGHTLKSSIIYNDEKLADSFGKMWNGNNVANLSEDEQLAWAEKQSIKAEEERLRRKEKEDAELALALELSKRGKSGNV